MSRYDVTGCEGEFEPGSDGRVLANLLGIIDPHEMANAETQLLVELYRHVFGNFPDDLHWQNLCDWHRKWLGNIYPWAGQIRSVDMAKPDIYFASPLQIGRLSNKYEQDYLSHFPTLPSMLNDDLTSFLAKAHVEFILIHPFREGNGRLSRLLLDVMAVKAGLQTLDYTLWDENKDFYFRAIQAGRDGDYQYVERLVRDVLEGQS